MLCPHCDHEVNEDSIDSLEGICPMCEGSLSKSSSMWDDAGEYDREYEGDDFDDELESEIDKELKPKGKSKGKAIVIEDEEINVDFDDEEDAEDLDE